MSDRPRFSWGAILSLAIGLFLMWLIFRQINPQEFVGALQQTKWGWIASALACGLLSHLFRALRWAQLAQPLGHRPAAHKAFYAVMSGYLANLALPRLGEITRCLLLARKTPLGFNGLVGTVVMERLMDLLVLLLLSLVTLVAYRDLLLEPVWNFVRLHIGWNGILLTTTGLLLAFSFGFWTWKFGGRLIPLPQPVRKVLQGIGEGMAGLGRLDQPGLFVVYTLLIWLGYLMMTYLCFFAFPGADSLGLGEALLLLVAGAFGFVMPVQGGMGAYHAAIVWTLGLLPNLNMSLTNALAFATLSHLAQTVLVVVVGGLSYFLMSLIQDDPSVTTGAKDPTLPVPPHV